jgi:3(or 17)beta-hydroxysteroid dehydrogenase
MLRFKDKIVLITGAARGIGAATASKFHAEGAIVIITDILDKQGQELAKELGDRAIYMHLDVSDEVKWQSLTSHIMDKFGRLDIIFNNAGITGIDLDQGPQDPENASLESWHKVHQVNLDGVFFGCKYAIQMMKAHGGAIINMSSRSGIVGIPGAAAYASSKAAIHNHTKTVALYCAEKGYPIRCNAVLPAAILTPLWESALGQDEVSKNAAIKAISAGIPIGYMGAPLDVAHAVLYLASEESRYLTGTDIIIDGGILAGSAASYKSK